MDATGEILAQPQERSVAGFQKTLDAMGALADLEARIAAGEEGLGAELLLAEHALGRVAGDAFKKRVQELAGVTPEQKVRIDAIVVDEEILRIGGSARAQGLEQAATQLLALREAGNLPTSTRAHSMFWSTLGRWAMQAKDAELARAAADGLAKAFAGDKGRERFVQGYVERADKLAAWKALAAKVEAGEEGCKADLALVAFDLGFLDVPGFRAEAAALAETATAEQKAALAAALVKAEFMEQIRGGFSRDPAERAAAAAALLALLDAGKQPHEDVALSVWSVLARHGTQTKDPDLLERAAAGFEATGDERVKGSITMLREQAAKLRAEAEAAPEAPKDG